MRLALLTRTLARVPDFAAPRLELEQYATPPDVAARMLLHIRAREALVDKVVADLGCGPGRLGLGAALLGATKVILVDIDPAALDQAREAARALGVVERCRFHQAEVSRWHEPVDTVVMNPPFGSQRRRADRPFMEVALQVADQVHSLHLALSVDYWCRELNRRGHPVEVVQSFIIGLDCTYPHHSRPKAEMDMVHLNVRPQR